MDHLPLLIGRGWDVFPIGEFLFAGHVPIRGHFALFDFGDRDAGRVLELDLFGHPLWDGRKAG